MSLSQPTPEYGTVPDLRVLDGVASWCGGLHGSMSLKNALDALAGGLDAQAAVISRHHHRTEDRPRVVAASSTGRTPPPARAYCGDILGYQFGRARAGTVWFISDMLQHDIEALVPTIERSWRGRKPGLVTQVIADDRVPVARRVTDRANWDVPILGMSNPASLSRAEFRVCLMLSRGLSAKAVSEELGLSENTVRSHLRAIYAKTETSSLPELIYRILSSGTEDAVAHAQRRA